MKKKIDYNRFKKIDSHQKAIVAIHGWGVNKCSFSPFAENIKVDNVEWFLPEAPYLVKDAPPTNSDNIDDRIKKGLKTALNNITLTSTV